MSHAGDKGPGDIRALTRELERVIGPDDSGVASASNAEWLRPWLLTPERVAELEALLREAPSGMGIVAAGVFISDRVGARPELEADTEPLDPSLNRWWLLVVAVLSLVFLVAGMIWPSGLGKWLMALAYALWVLVLILSGSAFGRSQKWTFVSIGLLLCAAAMLRGTQLSKEPWVIAGLAVVLIGVVIADRVLWSRSPRDARSK